METCTNQKCAVSNPAPARLPKETLAEAVELAKLSGGKESDRKFFFCNSAEDLELRDKVDALTEMGFPLPW